MNPRDLGKQRTSPVTQIGNHDFSWKPKNQIAQPKEPLIEYRLLNGSKKGCSELIPLSRVEAKEKSYKEQGIEFIKLPK